MSTSSLHYYTTRPSIITLIATITTLLAPSPLHYFLSLHHYTACPSNATLLAPPSLYLPYHHYVPLAPPSINHLPLHHSACSSITTLLVPPSLHFLLLHHYTACPTITTLISPPSLHYLALHHYIACPSITTLLNPPSITHFIFVNNLPLHHSTGPTITIYHLPQRR